MTIVELPQSNISGLPIIGSVADLPQKLIHIKFADWGKQYGPIYQVNLAGANHVWISRDHIARELLSKRKNIYSDRPHIPALIDDNRDSGQYLPLMSKNELWTRQRKFAKHIMRESEQVSFHNYPELESIRLVNELLEDAGNYNHHMESFISRVTCRLAWGHSEGSEELKQRARELLVAVSPNGALPNKLPFLMSLPDWLSPAKAWERKRARTERRWFQLMQDQTRQDQAIQGTKSSWMKMFLDAPGLFNFANETEGAYAVGMHGIAGALTIAAPMQAFCLAMCHYPQFLPMLQEELDQVCPGRLPTNADKPQLPFLRACIREVLRWRPPVPTGQSHPLFASSYTNISQGIPHHLSEDDEYDGYFIPKGSIIHPLEWSISRDPEMFPDPESFNPLRWLEPEYPTYKEPLTQHPNIINMTQFGYGHRTCMGQTVTEADLIAGIGAIAWAFTISKTPDPEAPRRRRLMSMLKASISTEELNTGMSAHSSDDEGSSQPRPSPPRPSSPHALPEKSPLDCRSEKERAAQRQAELEADPTLDFSTLLIAKPSPFKFCMTVRDEKKAQIIRDLYREQKEKGEFVPAMNYCKRLCHRNKGLLEYDFTNFFP